jgi:hypothetical protein
MREIDVPRMRRDVRALRHVAEVAQIALVDDLDVVALGNRIELAGLALVDEVEQRGERAAEADAAPAAVADLEDPPELLVERRLIVELRVAPVDRMARRRFEAAFAYRHDVWPACRSDFSPTRRRARLKPSPQGSIG